MPSRPITPPPPVRHLLGIRSETQGRHLVYPRQDATGAAYPHCETIMAWADYRLEGLDEEGDSFCEGESLPMIWGDGGLLEVYADDAVGVYQPGDGIDWWDRCREAVGDEVAVTQVASGGMN